MRYSKILFSALALGTLFSLASLGTFTPTKSASAQTSSGDQASSEREPKLASLRMKATRGDHISQNSLAYRLYYGMGVNKDRKEAFKWYWVAAEQGDAHAQTSLASAYLKGWGGVTKNPKRAHYWLMKAASKGYGQADYDLGRMYEWGVGVEQNRRRAIKFYSNAAKQGHTLAQVRIDALYHDPVAAAELAIYYWFGNKKHEGVQKDSREALLWSTLAVQFGFKKADVIFKHSAAKVSLKDGKVIERQAATLAKSWKGSRYIKPVYRKRRSNKRPLLRHAVYRVPNTSSHRQRRALIYATYKSLAMPANPINFE